MLSHGMQAVSHVHKGAVKQAGKRGAKPAAEEVLFPLPNPLPERGAMHSRGTQAALHGGKGVAKQGGKKGAKRWGKGALR